MCWCVRCTHSVDNSHDKREGVSGNERTKLGSQNVPSHLHQNQNHHRLVAWPLLHHSWLALSPALPSIRLLGWRIMHLVSQELSCFFQPISYKFQDKLMQAKSAVNKNNELYCYTGKCLSVRQFIAHSRRIASVWYIQKDLQSHMYLYQTVAVVICPHVYVTGVE